MSTFDFSTLSPDCILDGIESVGLVPESGLLALNSYENRVYRFTDQFGKKYVTKFYRPQRWSAEQIREEHEFAFELQGQDLPVVAPIKLANESLFTFQGFKFALFPCEGGRMLELDNLDQLEWMGRFIGRIHSVSKLKPFAYRPTIDTASYLIESADIIRASGFLPATISNAFFTILEQVITAAQRHYLPAKMIRVHGDCHAGNILWRDEGPHFVDLDDCRMGPAVQDLWMMLSGERDQQLVQLDTLLSGYEEFCDFDTKELALIESLRSMRVINYMAWLCKRWQDPAFPLNFPWFNTEKYWEQQILTLKEQLNALEQPHLSLNSNY